MKKMQITTFEEHLTKHYGPVGSPKRRDYEQKAQAFKIGVMIGEARRAQGMSQRVLAEKVGISLRTLSIIETDASTVRLDTLLRIIHVGLSGTLSVSIKFAGEKRPKKTQSKEELYQAC